LISYPVEIDGGRERVEEGEVKEKKGKEREQVANACMGIDNADCRGDVEDPTRTGNESCANTGWALWQIPDGDKNMFCCLPDHYGYWFPSLGQDAVGMCQSSPDLPEGSLPGVQFNNGDGSVDSNGTQIIALPVPAPTKAPTCDIVHYGWSLQVSDSSQCTEGSNYCSYGGSCCPSSLNCGTVIGASEVPVCCHPSNPDCRGDVEGLWPQLCADSSWALWHVNTNGNHFCCLPGQVGYNVPNDNAATGFCGSAVPNGTMRAILDYEGDGSKPGAWEGFPCDSNPAPNGSYSSISSAILNPGLARGLWFIARGGGAWGGGATKTIVKPWLSTSFVCPEGASETVAIIHSLSNGVPVTATSTVGAAASQGSAVGGTEIVGYATQIEVGFTATISGSVVTGTSTVGAERTSTVVEGAASSGSSVSASADVAGEATQTSTSRIGGVASGSGTMSSSPIAFTGGASRMRMPSTVLAIGAFAAWWL
jgi:hypothetical protein